jgi:DNA-binding CsgD family transcriptional regulator
MDRYENEPSASVEAVTPQISNGISTDLQARLARLTPRQKDCLRLVRPGYPSKAIARELEISPLRVDAHVGDAKVTLGIGSRFEAARMLRLWEQNGVVATLGAQLGAQSQPLPQANDLLSDSGVVDPVGGSQAPPPVAPAEQGKGWVVTSPLSERIPQDRFERSVRHVRVAPSFFAAAVSIIAIAIAIGAVTALLIACDWGGHS